MNYGNVGLARTMQEKGNDINAPECREAVKKYLSEIIAHCVTKLEYRWLGNRNY